MLRVHVIMSYTNYILYPRPRQTSNIAVETFLSMLLALLLGSVNGREVKTFSASEKQTLCLQHMLLGLTNEQTFGEHTKSVFRSVSGLKVEQIQERFSHELARSSEAYVILHAGTNNLESGSVDVILDS